jgi:tetratricopeptide (TPR) repeat protein
MRPSLRIAAAIAVLFLSTSVGHAQFRGGFGQRQGVAFQVRTGPQSSFTYVASSYGFGFGPVYGPPPNWYYGSGGYPYWNTPVVVQPPIVIQNIVQQPAGLPPAARGAVIPPEFDPPAAKAPAKGAKLGPAPKPPEIEPPKPVPLGRADADRIADAGRKAFADGQYGRALELFRKALEITPAEPSAHYLVSQALFALGKYREAVAAIAAGMTLRADWPEARFVSRDLYWKTPATFDEHLNALRQAVAGFPDDAGLLFLLGHQLWFDGKQDEARALIAKAREIDNGKSPAGGFKTR